MMTLGELAKICDSKGGITSIKLSEISNISAALTLINPASVLVIEPRPQTAKYTERPLRSGAGEAIEANLSLFVPMRRSEVNTLRTQVANRRIAAVFIDRHGGSYVMPRCRVAIEFDSGQKLGDDEGYTITITSLTATNSQPTYIPYTPPPIVIPALLPGADSAYSGGAGAGSQAPPTNACLGFKATMEVDGYNLSVTLISEPDTLDPVVYLFTHEGTLVQESASATYTATLPGNYAVEVQKGNCTAGAAGVVLSGCELLTIIPFLTDKWINANIINPPLGYTIEVLDTDNLVIATALPFELTDAGTYYIKVKNGTICERIAGITLDISICSFSVSLELEGSVLTYTTDAIAPLIVEWIYETEENGEVILADTTPSIFVGASGLYKVKITQDTCTAEAEYIYIKSSKDRNFEAHYNFTGDTLTLFNIDLAKISNPETQLVVRIGSTVATHAATPEDEYQYAILGQSIKFWTILSPSNQNIYINEV